ncbi:MAG TPA: histidine kinase dimerization/phospho-acceptor domain-containing protein, partial [Vicinamibacterales bacterium]|nr:histidine kinase dimerization/phospho-acceptor domain-containing protein [Vicinamibacterales bacterium]
MTAALRILHLEDSTADAALAAATVAGGGIAATIQQVDSRAAFETALAAESFDVILADYNLPSFDGAAAQVTAARICPDVPFIFLSGSIGEDFAVERLKAGATDYVLKDRMARLPSAIHRALREAAERAKRREAEEALHRLNTELEQRVIERTNELRIARIEAERANRAKSDFISRMSHDLRTPLNAILGFAQLLREKELDAEDREGVDLILRGGRHLLDLINEVLDIARIEAGHLSLSLEPIDASEVVRQAVELVEPLARKRRITLRAPETRELTVNADRQRLNQILMNLLSNAVKYNRPDGRVTVAFET